jgi:two-component system sensor histidine kinase ChvG
MRHKKTASILKKFLLFNLSVFSVLGLFTLVYLKAIQPNLVKKRASNHYIIINNTVDHLKRLQVNFNAKDIKTFLLSTRFLFQSLDRVQFFSIKGELIGDTNILDLDQNVFTRPDIIIEETIDGKVKQKNNSREFSKEEENKDLIKETILNEYKNEPITISRRNQNNFIVSTLSKVNFDNKEVCFIVVSEEANDILNAVKERKAFIIN